LGYKIAYVGTSEHESAEDKLEIAQDLGAQEESTNTSKTPLQRLRYVFEKFCDGSHFEGCATRKCKIVVQKREEEKDAGKKCQSQGKAPLLPLGSLSWLRLGSIEF